MSSKKYVLVSFGLLAAVVADYFYDLIKFNSNPAEFLITSDVTLVAVILSMAFAFIGIRKGNKWGWLAIGLCALPLILGGLIYFSLSNWKF